MFGNKSLPSRIFSYGANAPIEGLDLVNEQMKLAHRYRNSLVELEHSRRKKVNEALAKLSPRLVEVEELLIVADQKVEDAADAIRKASGAARKKVRPPEMVAEMKQCKEVLKALRAERKQLRTFLFASAAWEQEQETLNAWTTVQQKELRANCGLYWGTYLHVEQSMAGTKTGPPPRFYRYDGTGHLAVQLQKGLSPKEAQENDPRIRIEVVPEGVYRPGKNRPKKLGNAIVHFRVGSDKSGDPIFARIPFILHRPLPEDAQIKWVHLISDRVGTHSKWLVQFVVSKESWPKADRATSGHVGVDVGWRMKEDGLLRVAVWKGSDGQDGELTLPTNWLPAMGKTRHIRSIRDKNFDMIRPELVAWLKERQDLPEWMKEPLTTMHQWKAQARLASFMIRWRTERFPGDEQMFQKAEDWRKRDRHLYDYESNLRDQLLAQRSDLYRNFAAKLRRQYKTAALEDLDLRDFHVLPAVEDPMMDPALKEHVRDACLSSLLQYLKESMGGFIEVPAANTTKKCHSCGSIQEWDHKILRHTCTKCGKDWDQDYNAAINIGA